jgi:hypothetical protein
MGDRESVQCFPFKPQSNYNLSTYTKQLHIMIVIERTKGDCLPCRYHLLHLATKPSASLPNSSLDYPQPDRTEGIMCHKWYGEQGWGAKHTTIYTMNNSHTCAHTCWRNPELPLAESLLNSHRVFASPYE